MTQPAIALYSKPNCNGCFATKRALDKRDLTYTEVDISVDEGALAYVVNDLGHTQAPVVVLDDDTHWSGFRPDLIQTHIDTKDNA